jgi:hypothetical protein
MPTLIDGTDLIEFSNGVRLTDEQLRRLGRGRSHRNLAEMLGISYIELNDGRALARGEEFDPDDDLGTPPKEPPDLPQDHPSNQPKPGYRPDDK